MQTTIDFINSKTNNLVPETGIILGSGLGDFVNNFESISIPYAEIPEFQTSEVQGHAGKLVFVEKMENEKLSLLRSSSHVSRLKSHPSLIIMQGRYHFYEGHPMEKVVFPIKVMKKLGVKNLIITNAAGSINKKFKPSDLMLITDHINFMGTNPLIGKNEESLGTRFPDMSEIYNKNLIKLAESAAREIGINVRKGVYAATSGPSYETPAEVKMFKKLGADALGMSTVPEAIVANYCGMNVLGISCLSNHAAGVQKTPLSHEEVIETTSLAKEKFQALLLSILGKL